MFFWWCYGWTLFLHLQLSVWTVLFPLYSVCRNPVLLSSLCLAKPLFCLIYLSTEPSAGKRFRREREKKEGVLVGWDSFDCIGVADVELQSRSLDRICFLILARRSAGTE
jgi:hypothetical protein